MKRINRFVPWIHWEQLDVPAAGLLKTDPEIFRNSTDDDVIIDRVIIDSNSVTTSSMRFGLRGRGAQSETFVHSRALHNTQIMNQATDCAWPLLTLRHPVLIQPRQQLSVELEDTIAGGARTANVLLSGYKEKTQPGATDPFILVDRVEIPDGGVVSARMQSDQDFPVWVDSFSLYVEETGTAAKMRGLRVAVTGAGMPDWIDGSGRRAIASVVFPDRNGASEVYTPPGRFVLKPGESFEGEVHDTSGSAKTLFLGIVGYALDRRM